ncbi:hypothetical protein [Frankia gtarii]|nr:hypothetical protein [Frankia gtarii]
MPRPSANLGAVRHGLTTLGRNDRLRPGHDTDRIDLLVAQFRTARSPLGT